MNGAETQLGTGLNVADIGLSTNYSRFDDSAGNVESKPGEPLRSWNFKIYHFYKDPSVCMTTMIIPWITEYQVKRQTNKRKLALAILIFGFVQYVLFSMILKPIFEVYKQSLEQREADYYRRKYLEFRGKYLVAKYELSDSSDEYGSLFGDNEYENPADEALRGLVLPIIVLGIIVGALFVVRTVLAIKTRFGVRKLLGIKGGLLQDALCAIACSKCAKCQIKQELDYCEKMAAETEMAQLKKRVEALSTNPQL